MPKRSRSGEVSEPARVVAPIRVNGLTNLEPHDVLFIDEIHRLSPVVEEILYPAMEDYQLDIMIGEGPADPVPADRRSADDRAHRRAVALP